MAFEELLNFCAPPTQLRWLLAILAAEGSPALIIREAHKESLGTDIRDRMLPDLVINELLLHSKLRYMVWASHSRK
jgi:hypothetical protein